MEIDSRYRGQRSRLGAEPRRPQMHRPESALQRQRHFLPRKIPLRSYQYNYLRIGILHPADVLLRRTPPKLIAWVPPSYVAEGGTIRGRSIPIRKNSSD